MTNIGQGAGATTNIGDTDSGDATLRAGNNLIELNTSATAADNNVTIRSGSASTTVTINDAGVRFQSTAVGANPGGGDLRINSDGSISSGNTALNAGRSRRSWSSFFQPRRMPATSTTGADGWLSHRKAGLAMFKAWLIV